jgi:hypothetical protein
VALGIDHVIDHVDDTGGLCARHPQATAASLLQLAMVGSRAPAFHHDCASKLQGMLMALDELTELTENGDPQITRAIEAAMTASRELNALLNINRSLTRQAARTSISVRQLVGQAAERAAVRLEGELPDTSVSVAVPPTTHGLALAIDVAAGSGRGRTLTVSASVAELGVELALHAKLPAPSNASELLAIATFVFDREGGALWCAAADDRLLIRLPLG